MPRRPKPRNQAEKARRIADALEACGALEQVDAGLDELAQLPPWGRCLAAQHAGADDVSEETWAAVIAVLSDRAERRAAVLALLTEPGVVLGIDAPAERAIREAFSLPPADDDEPPIPDDDPGPEVDDEGGMSEVRRSIAEEAAREEFLTGAAAEAAYARQIAEAGL